MDRFAALLEYQYERWGGTRHPVSRTVGSCPAPGQVVPGDPGPAPPFTIHHDKSGHQIWRQRERAGERATGDSALFAVADWLAFLRTLDQKLTFSFFSFGKNIFFQAIFFRGSSLCNWGATNFFLSYFFAAESPPERAGAGGSTQHMAPEGNSKNL